jgi:predicted nucleotidyltransferase
MLATVGPEARREVERRVDAIEADEGVRILFACESGSRAWGFASSDSDYDVRFLYLRPRAFYLSIDLEDRRDVIETPLDGVWDVNGWDLRKALKLMRKSNPPLFEWLQSPIVYRETSSVPAQLRARLADHYRPDAALRHYLHMARGNFREYLRGEEVWRKKYLYVLRPLLACRWTERGLGPAPTEFERLVHAVLEEPGVREALARLLEEKRAGAELDRGPRIAALSHFIAAELSRYESLPPRESRTAEIDPLNRLFADALDEVWGA